MARRPEGLGFRDDCGPSTDSASRSEHPSRLDVLVRGFLSSGTTPRLPGMGGGRSGGLSPTRRNGTEWSVPFSRGRKGAHGWSTHLDPKGFATGVQDGRSSGSRRPGRRQTGADSCFRTPRADPRRIGGVRGGAERAILGHGAETSGGSDRSMEDFVARVARDVGWNGFTRRSVQERHGWPGGLLTRRWPNATLGSGLEHRASRDCVGKILRPMPSP